MLNTGGVATLRLIWSKPERGSWDSRYADHQGRTSGASTVLPVWVNGAFRPVRVMIIRGKNRITFGNANRREVGVAVCFGIGRFKVGQGECEMMTSDENHHLVFPLVTTACDYTKLDEYFGELRKAEIEVMQTQGDFVGNLAVREVARTKNQRLMSKMGQSEAIISDMKDTIRNSLLRLANTIFWMPPKRKRFSEI